MPDAERCGRRTRRGTPCNRRGVGLGYPCPNHGGDTPIVQERVTHAVVRRGLAKLVEPIDADDPEANPLNSFDVEFRRTIAAIRYYDSKITELTDEHDLVWGMTRQVEQGSGEFTGTDTTYESKINIYEERRFQERKHLVELQKLWITAKLGERKLAIEAATLDALQQVIDSILVGMNADPHDPAVRSIVSDAFTRATASKAAIEA